MRPKCLFRPFGISVTSRPFSQSHSPATRPSVGSAREPKRFAMKQDQNIVSYMFYLKFPVHLSSSKISTLDVKRGLLLLRLIREVQSTPKGVQKNLPDQYLDLLASSYPHTLLPNSRAVQFISFLLREQRAHIAVHAYSVLLHRGIEFSLAAMERLCKEAASMDATRPATTFSQYTAKIISRGGSTALQAPIIIENLLWRFHRYHKHDAIIQLGTTFIKEESSISVGILPYIFVLQALFAIHRSTRHISPIHNVTNTGRLLDFLSGWMSARTRDRIALGQYDTSILIKGLASLLLAVNPQEHPLPAALRMQVMTLLSMLVQGISSPMVRLTVSEVVLDLYEAHHGSTNGNGAHDDAELPSYASVIEWTARWELLLRKDRELPHTTGASHARALKILARDYVYRRDVPGALDRIQDIISIQEKLSTSLSNISNNASPRENASLRRSFKDASLRFNGTLIRISSKYLRTQDLPALFRILPFTKQLTDMKTFVRLWKRSMHLIVSKGTWKGRCGTRAALELLQETIPEAWNPKVVGELIFDSPWIVEAIFRISIKLPAPPPNASASHFAQPDMTTLLLLVKARPEAFRQWKSLFLSFHVALPPNVRNVVEHDKTHLIHSLMMRIK